VCVCVCLFLGSKVDCFRTGVLHCTYEHYIWFAREKRYTSPWTMGSTVPPMVAAKAWTVARSDRWRVSIVGRGIQKFRSKVRSKIR